MRQTDGRTTSMLNAPDIRGGAKQQQESAHITMYKWTLLLATGNYSVTCWLRQWVTGACSRRPRSSACTFNLTNCAFPCSRASVLSVFLVPISSSRPRRSAPVCFCDLRLFLCARSTLFLIASSRGDSSTVGGAGYSTRSKTGSVRGSAALRVFVGLAAPSFFDLWWSRLSSCSRFALRLSFAFEDTTFFLSSAKAGDRGLSVFSIFTFLFDFFSLSFVSRSSSSLLAGTVAFCECRLVLVRFLVGVFALSSPSE